MTRRRAVKFVLEPDDTLATAMEKAEAAIVRAAIDQTRREDGRVRLAEAARRLGWHRVTLWRWRKKHELWDEA